MTVHDNGYAGHENLEIISQSHRFNNWMYKRISRGLRDRGGYILEVGSGLGTFSGKIIQEIPSESQIVLTDLSTNYIEVLKEKFSNQKNVSVSRLDLDSKEDYLMIGYEKFNSIIALNVLEHVRDDEYAFRELYKMLKKGGVMTVLVPCHKVLYNVIDTHLGHFRRYTKNELEEKISKTDFVIENIFYFNMLGILGWYINGNLFKRATISASASRLYDKLVPILEYVEPITFRNIGLSLICYLRK